MGCACSHSERAVAANIPSSKTNGTPLSPTSSVVTRNNSNEKNTDPRDPGKRSSSMSASAESFVSPHNSSESQKSNGIQQSSKVTITKSQKETILKSSLQIPNFDSVSSIEPKERVFVSQKSRTKSNENSQRDNASSLDSRSSFSRLSKPSIFLSPHLFSGGTISSYAGTSHNINTPKSILDGSLNSIRLDSHRGLLFNNPDKVSENVMSRLQSPGPFLVVPEVTNSSKTFTEPRSGHWTETNEGYNFENIEDSSTRAPFGDTPRETLRGNYIRSDSMDPSVRPWVAGKIREGRKSSSVSGKGYKISVVDMSSENQTSHRNRGFPRIKLHEDGLLMDPNALKIPQPQLGTPKHGLPSTNEQDEGIQLTLNIPISFQNQFRQIVEKEMGNVEETPKAKLSSRDSSRRSIPKVEVIHPEAEPYYPVPKKSKDEAMKDFIEKKVRINLIDVIRSKREKEEADDLNQSILLGQIENIPSLKKTEAEEKLLRASNLLDALSMNKKEKILPKPLEFGKLNLSEAPLIISPSQEKTPPTGNSSPRNLKPETSFLKPIPPIMLSDLPLSVEDRMSYQEGISYIDLGDQNLGPSIQEIDCSPMNLHPHRPSKISAFGAKKHVFNKSKSVNLDSPIPAEKNQHLDLPKNEKHETSILPTTPKHTLLTPFYGKEASQESMKDVSFVQLLGEDKKKMFAKHRPKSQVIETDLVNKSVSEAGHKKINQYVLGVELGRGTFGKVKLAVDTETNTRYAIKIINKAKLKKKVFAKNKTAYTQIQTEIAIMTKMAHPNTVKLSEVIDAPDEDKLYLVMEYVELGAVMGSEYYAKTKGKIIEREAIMAAGTFTFKSLPEETARKYFRDLILGIDYMHNYANVVHRDIKPENLLICGEDKLKLSDFGIAHLIDESNDVIKTKGGTRHFLAPEAWIKDSFRGRPLDIWAAGATLYYFLYGTAPFPTTNAHELKRMILEEEPKFPANAGISQGAVKLIQACLTKSVEDRITLKQIFQDPWLTKNGEEPLGDNEMFEVVEVNAEEISKALSMKLQTALLVATGLVRSLQSARKTLSSMQFDSILMDKLDE